MTAAVENFLLLSPHYPPRIYFFADSLKRKGYGVLGVGDADWGSLNGELRSWLKDYRKQDLNCFDETKSVGGPVYDRILETVLQLGKKHGRIGFVESFNEWWLPLEARLRKDAGAWGVGPEGLQSLIRKSIMKDRFRKGGVPVVEGEIVSGLERCLRFFHEQGDDIVVKPDVGVGSSDTRRFRSEAEVREFWDRKNPRTVYFMERYIGFPERQLTSFDGLCDREGNVVLYAVHCYNDGDLEVSLGADHTLTYSLKTSEVPEGLERIGLDTVKAFTPEINGRFFHIEFFRVGDRYFGLEMNARPPGVVHLDMINLERGINVWDVYAAVAAGERPAPAFKDDRVCMHLGMYRRIKYKHSAAEVVSRYGRHIAMAVTDTSNLIGDYGWVFVVDDQEKRREILQFATERE